MSEKEFMNLEIGKTFNIGYRKFEVVKITTEYNCCENCFFDKDDGFCTCIGLDMQVEGLIPYCSNYNRTDNKNIIFKEVK